MSAKSAEMNSPTDEIKLRAGLLGLAAMKTVRSSYKIVIATIVVGAIVLTLFIASGGVRTVSHDPVRMDAGMFRRWSANHDNNRVIETKNRFGQVEAYKHTKAGSFALGRDKDGYIWCDTPQ